MTTTAIADPPHRRVRLRISHAELDRVDLTLKALAATSETPYDTIWRAVNGGKNVDLATSERVKRALGGER